jgi:hypothetical protein
VLTHSGKYCFGKTLMQTLMDSIPLAQEKLLERLAEDQILQGPHKKGTKESESMHLDEKNTLAKKTAAGCNFYDALNLTVKVFAAGHLSLFYGEHIRITCCHIFF